MAISVPFALVDVFADAPLTGNPLAVIADAERLDDAQMAALAREFNQSETTFVLPPTLGGATWRLRSFTPAGAEVFGAGHNALGAWWWLVQSGRVALDNDGSAALRQEIGGRVLALAVTARDGHPNAIVMEQAPPEFGRTLSDKAPLAKALGLYAHDLIADAEVVSTGTAHLLAAARDRATVDRARPTAPKLANVLAEVGGQGCLLYSLDPIHPGSVAYARFFNPTVGIAEDPATGSAAGPLVSLLLASGAVAEDTVAMVEQGYATGRPSRIIVRASRDRVRIGGRCIVVGEGTLTL